MRVIAGEARSLPLKAPQGQDTRPTTDRIKETLFNILQTRIPCNVFKPSAGAPAAPTLWKTGGRRQNVLPTICISQNLRTGRLC